MKPGIPWSVKGIEPEAREAAKYAARRSGMTLGEWLNSLILEQAESGAEMPTHVLPQRLRPASDTAIRLEDLAHQLARLTQRDQDTAAGLVYEQTAARSHDTTALDSLSGRIEHSERQTVDAFAAINERLNSITHQLNESHKVWQPQRPEDVPGYQALEGALRNIVDHIEVSEKRTRDQLKSMQDRMADLSHRAASAPDDRIIQNAPAFTRLEGRINDLSTRFERSAVETRADMPPAVESQLSRLAERIESVRQNSESAIQQAQTAAAEGARSELEQVENRIHTFLKEAQASLEGAGNLGKLHGDIESLNQRIDDLRADAASERDLHGVKQAIEQLSARIAQGTDLRPLAEMDRRMAEMTQRLEQSRDYSGLGTQLGEIDRRIHELDQRMTMLVQRGSGGDSEGFRGFEQHITALSERLGAAEMQFGHIGTLERSINQLFESIEQSRRWTREVAEEAANQMADRLIQSNPAWASAQEGGPSPELRALEDGLAAVRASAESADSRNQETLIALHETLEQIVNKLAEIEMSPAQPDSVHQVQHMQPAFVPETPELPELPALQPLPRAQRGQQGPDIFGIPHAFAAAPEPQLQEAESPELEEAAEQPPQLADAAAVPPEGELDPADDFIAAARRAAQTAANNAAAPLTTGDAVKPEKAKGRRFSMPFRRGRKTDQKPEVKLAPHPILPDPKQSRAGAAARRIPLIAAGLVLLAAVTAITFKQMSGTSDQSPVPQDQSQSDSILPDVKSPPTAVSAPVVTETGKSGTIQGTMPAPAAAPTSLPGSKTSNIMSDELLTSALPPGKSDASLQAIVAEPAPAASASTGSDVPDKAIQPESLRQAAAKGDPAAQFIVASRYLDGQSVQQDFTEAAHWYQKAASQGLAPAQYRIATLFERGKGVPLDMATARVWYERAAERGNVRAMHNVAVIFASVQSGSPNYDKAAQWFISAAEHGLKDSQYNLAVLYERGMGVRKSMGDALFWYSMAAAQDDADAGKRASVLERTLAPATINEVKQRISKWTAKPANQEANVIAVSDQAWQIPDAAPEPMGGTSEHQSSAPPVQTGNPVQRAQELLVKHGFNIGEPDGRMGTRTANAIRLFELQSGMRVTGEVSEELLNELEARPVSPPA